MASSKKLNVVADEASPQPHPSSRACGVAKLPDGHWVARIYEIDAEGGAKVIKESVPDLRAVAIERLHVYTAQCFLF